MPVSDDDVRECALRLKVIFQPGLNPFFRILRGSWEVTVLRRGSDHLFVTDTGHEDILHKRVYIEAVAVCEYQAIIWSEQNDALI